VYLIQIYLQYMVLVLDPNLSIWCVYLIQVYLWCVYLIQIYLYGACT